MGPAKKTKKKTTGKKPAGKKSSRKKPSKKKPTRVKAKPLSAFPLFFDSLKITFSMANLIPNAAELTLTLKAIENPPNKWAASRLKKELMLVNVITYSKANPKGYRLDLNQIDAVLEGKIEKISVSPKKSPTETVAKESETTPKPEKKATPSSKSESKKGTKSVIESSSTDSAADILSKIPNFSQYLMNRISDKAQRALQLGVLEINRSSLSTLIQNIDHLTSALMFFDEAYDKEKEIVKAINQKIDYMNNLQEQLHEKEGELLIRKNFIEPLKKGKFDKIVKKWGPEYGVEDCAWEILKKMGRKAKKIPLSEFVLRKKIAEVLKEQYPDKN